MSEGGFQEWKRWHTEKGGSIGQGAIKKKDNFKEIPECPILGGVVVGGSYNAGMGFGCGGVEMKKGLVGVLR